MNPIAFSCALDQGTNPFSRNRFRSCAVTQTEPSPQMSPRSVSSSRMSLLDLRIRPRSSVASSLNQSDESLEFLLDQVSGMRQREVRAYGVREYLQPAEEDARPTYIFFAKSPARILLIDTSVMSLHDPIDECSRELMALWVFRIVDHFGLPREFGAISMSYVDRFLSVYDCDKNIFKLACMAAIYMTTKTHGVAREMILPSCLSQLSHGEFTERDIAKMEGILLHALKWQVNPPTAYNFISICGAFFLPETSVHIRDAMLNIACFLTDLGTCDYSLGHYKRSQMAAAAVLLSIRMTSKFVLSSNERSHMYDAVFHLLGARQQSEEIELLISKLSVLYKRSEQFQRVDQADIATARRNDWRTKERKDLSCVQTSPACVYVMGSEPTR